MHDMDGHSRVVWSPEAIADLDGIWDYYEEVAEVQTAETITRDIYRKCSMVQGHPLLGRDRHTLRLGFQSVVADPFVIFYIFRSDVLIEIYPAHPIIRNSFGSMMRKLSVTASQ
jgi:toxin ParE1/3/4